MLLYTFNIQLVCVERYLKRFHVNKLCTKEETLTEASLIFDQQTHADIFVPCKHEYNVLVEEGIL